MKVLTCLFLLMWGTVQGQSQDSIYHAPDHPASFPGGQTEMMTWLKNNLYFPDSLFRDKDDILSKLTINFVVERDGRLSEIRVASSGTQEQNRYIAGIIKSMPRWKPATDNGISVRSSARIPVACIKYD